MDNQTLQTMFQLGLVSYATVMIIFGISCGVALAKAPYRKK